MRAEQSLILFPGDREDAFAMQMDSLGHIRNVIFNTLKGRDGPRMSDKRLRLTRRVFTKVSYFHCVVVTGVLTC